MLCPPQAIVEQLAAEAERVKSSMQTTTILSAYSVYAQYLQTLQQQVDIFNTMLQQLQIYAKHPDMPRIGPQVIHKHSAEGKRQQNKKQTNKQNEP